jgi:hypothetical protein
MSKKPLAVDDFTHFGEISPVRKRLVVLFIIIVAIIIIGVPLIFAQRAYYRNVESSWNEVVTQSGLLGSGVTLITSEQNARNLSNDLDQAQKIITDQQLFLNKLNKNYFFVFQNKQLLKTLNYYQNYLNSLKNLVKNPVTFTDRELEAVKDQARLLQSSVNVLLTSSKLRLQLPSQIYILPDKLRDVRNQYQKDQQLKTEQQSRAAQIASNESETNRHATDFMNAYIAGNADEMKRYMTDQYIKEFDFNQLNSDYRKYDKP